MRTHLIRLTYSAAGVVLTGIGFAASAHASEVGPSIDENPQYVESIVPAEQAPQRCDIELTLPECVASEDDEPQLMLPVDPAMSVPGWWDDVTLQQPGDDSPDEPEGEAPDEPDEELAGDDTGSAEPAEPGDASEPSDPSNPGPTGAAGPSSDSGETTPDTADGSAAEDAAGEPTPESEETRVIPATESSAVDDSPNADLLVSVLVTAMAAVGLGTIGFALGQRPTQAPRRNRR
jgi:hypothetical protein